MTKQHELKQMARDSLLGKYSAAACALLLYFLCTTLLAILLNFTAPAGYYSAVFFLYPTAGSVIVFLLSSVLLAGLLDIHLKIARGEYFRTTDLFLGFINHPDRIIVAQLIIFFFIALCTFPVILCFFPAQTGGGLVLRSAASPVMTICAVMFSLCAMLWVYLTYSQAIFLYADQPDTPSVLLLQRSRQLMKGKRLRLLLLKLSFLGYFLLGLLSLGIGLLWVYPYYFVSCANFYENLICTKV